MLVSMKVEGERKSHTTTYNLHPIIYATKHIITAHLIYKTMLDATLIIKNADGAIDTFHAHSSSDDIQDILIQLEDDLLEYGDR